jgi:probable HAF family extracellular repeat protein
MLNRLLRFSVILSAMFCAHLASSQSDAFLWTAAGGMQDLGVLTGWEYSGGYGINQAGVIVGGLSKPKGEGYVETSFGWRKGLGMHYLKGMSLKNSTPMAVNNSGQVVGGGWTAEGQTHAFLWSLEGGTQDLGTLGGASSVALAINNSGQVVGWSQTPTGIAHAFLWTEESGMQDLTTLTHRSCAGCETFALAISESGVIVGKVGDHEGARDYAFVWKNGNVKVLGDLGGTGANGGSLALGINRSGQVVGVADTSVGTFHAFIWTDATGMQDLGTLPGGSYSQASAINNLGQVVGWSYDAGGNTHAFLWDLASGMQDLGTLGGLTSQASAINDAGEVTGAADLE